MKVLIISVWFLINEILPVQLSVTQNHHAKSLQLLQIYTFPTQVF